MALEEKNVLVYLFKSDIEKDVIVDGFLHHFNIDDVYYVGEGNKDRISNMSRNVTCNKLTEELNGKLEVHKKSLTKSEARSLEKELINKYLNEDCFLSNILGGTRGMCDENLMSNIKFLNILREKGFLNMSINDISCVLNYNVNWKDLNSNEQYEYSEPKPPENLNEIITKYAYNDEMAVLKGKIKYVLNMIQNDVLKMNIREVTDFFKTYHQVVKEAKEINYAIKPDNDVICELVSKYGFHVHNDRETKYRMVVSCLNIKQQQNLFITDTQIANLFEGVTLSNISDIKRRQTSHKPIKLPPSILGELMSYSYSYLNAY